MMGALLAVKAFAATWWKVALAFVAGALLCFPLAYCEGKQAERAAWNAKVAEAKAKAEKKQRAADAARTARAAADARRIGDNRQEVNDATRTIPDQGLSARQRARACIELRRQNAPARELDAACGPAQPPR